MQPPPAGNPPSPPGLGSRHTPCAVAGRGGTSLPQPERHTECAYYFEAPGRRPRSVRVTVGILILAAAGVTSNPGCCGDHAEPPRPRGTDRPHAGVKLTL